MTRDELVAAVIVDPSAMWRVLQHAATITIAGPWETHKRGSQGKLLGRRYASVRLDNPAAVAKKRDSGSWTVVHGTSSFGDPEQYGMRGADSADDCMRDHGIVLVPE